MYSHVKASCLFASLALVTFCTSASAQDPNYQAQPTAEPTTTAQPAPYYPPAPEPMVLQQPMDGPRFRFGVSGGLGGEFVEGLSGLMFGMDLRLGVQINHLVGIYAQPHLSFGKLSDGSGSTGYTGTFVGTAMVDFTLFDHLSLGAGFGYGILNNPSGPALAFRVAAYPVVSISELGPRRRGLMVGLDLRTVFTDQGTGVLIMGAVGYEAF